MTKKHGNVKKFWPWRHDFEDDFKIYGQFTAIPRLISRRMGHKTSIFINSNLLFYKNGKQN